MDILKDLSLFIEAKVNEEVKKSRVLTLKLLEENPNLLRKGTLITGSYAKIFYGFKKNISRPKDLDLVLIDNDYKELYLFADSFMPKDYRTGSWNSIIMKKEEEVHYKKPIATFASDCQFVEVFENVSNLSRSDSVNGHVPLIELVKCAKEWNREKDKLFLQEISDSLKAETNS